MSIGSCRAGLARAQPLGQPWPTFSAPPIPGAFRRQRNTPNGGPARTQFGGAAAPPDHRGGGNAGCHLEAKSFANSVDPGTFRQRNVPSHSGGYVARRAARPSRRRERPLPHRSHCSRSRRSCRVPTFLPLWTFHGKVKESGIGAMPAGGFVYVDADRAIHALEASSGKEVWTRNTRSIPQAVDAGRLYYTDQNTDFKYFVQALEPRTGASLGTLQIADANSLSLYGALRRWWRSAIRPSR